MTNDLNSHRLSQINDVPVSHISDIEPLVYESSATIKFLVARPAQEVCLTIAIRETVLFLFRIDRNTIVDSGVS